VSALTTNDVRVLRLLADRGPHTRDEIGRALRFGLGAESALRRLPGLMRRGLVGVVSGFYPGSEHWVLDVTGEGARQLRRCDEAAYGRWA
jgi:hypothetical protein